MRIGFDVSKIASADGLGTFTREVHAALGALVGNAHEIVPCQVLDPDAAPPEASLDVFVATSFALPPLAAGTRVYFVVYDLTFLTLPHCHTLGNRLHCLDGLISSLSAGATLLAISGHGATELGKLLGRDPAAIPVLPLAPGPDFYRRDSEETARRLAPLGLEAGSYLLAAGSLEPRKNFAALLAAHAALPEELRKTCKLVMAGSAGWKNAGISREMARSTAAGDLEWLGHVDRETLVALYNGAAVFAYPSLAEGYGLPVIEAMACGAPVLTSNVSALPETAGGAARLVDPLDVAGMAAALRELLDSPGERRRLRELGLARAAGLSWQKTARILLDLLLSSDPKTRTSP